MRGNNELRLNQATMCEAVQSWLDRSVLINAGTAKVQRVEFKSENDGDIFVVALRSDEEPADGDTPPGG